MKRALLPILLVASGLSLLIGCLYIPTFEKPAWSTEKDFRKFVGDDPSRPLRTGNANRAMVLELLGPPPLASADGCSIGYLFKTHQGYWLGLCGSSSADDKVRGLRLDFGKDNILQQFKVASSDSHDGTRYPVGAVIAQLNESGAPIGWYSNQLPADFDLKNR